MDLCFRAVAVFVGTAGVWDGEWLHSEVELIAKVLALLPGGGFMGAYCVVKKYKRMNECLTNGDTLYESRIMIDLV